MLMNELLGDGEVCAAQLVPLKCVSEPVVPAAQMLFAAVPKTV